VKTGIWLKQVNKR